jgi:hypothetical protein
LPRVVRIGLDGVRRNERLSFFRSKPVAHCAPVNADLARDLPIAFPFGLPALDPLLL